MFILNGLYSLVRAGGPSRRNCSSSIRAIDCLFLFSALVFALSMLLLCLSAAMISLLCRFESVPLLLLPLPLMLRGVLAPFALLPELTPSVLLGTESVEAFLSLELPSFSPNFLKGFLRNDMSAAVNCRVLLRGQRRARAEVEVLSVL
jgi:hypothetical protein